MDLKRIWNNFFVISQSQKLWTAYTAQCAYASKDKMIRFWPKFLKKLFFYFISTYRDIKIIKIKETKKSHTWAPLSHIRTVSSSKLVWPWIKGITITAYKVWNRKHDHNKMADIIIGGKMLIAVVPISFVIFPTPLIS